MKGATDAVKDHERSIDHPLILFTAVATVLQRAITVLRHIVLMVKALRVRAAMTRRSKTFTRLALNLKGPVAWTFP